MKSRSLSVCLDLDLFLILSLICIQLTTPIVITSDSEEDRPRAALSTFTVDVLLTIEHISGIDFFSQTIDVICTVEIWQSGLNSSVLEHRLQNDNKPINSPFNDILFESEDETQLGVQHLTLLHGKVVASRTSSFQSHQFIKLPCPQQLIHKVFFFACILISETAAKKYRNLQCEDRDVREQSVVKYQQQATKNARYRESSHTSEAKFAPTTVVGVEFRKRADASSLCSARIDILSRTICPLVYIIFTMSVPLLSDSAPLSSPSPLSSSLSPIPPFHWSHISTSPGSILLLLLNASTTCICIECDLDPFFSLSQLGEGAHEQFTANQPGCRTTHWRQPNLKQSRHPIQVSSLECMTCLTTPSTTQLDNFRITTRLNRPVCPMEPIKCDRDQTACVTITMHIGMHFTCLFVAALLFAFQPF
ncbi:hypothetical protein WR25_15037 [Diploscapter pachys]|uniref:ZP domain-containing protein n=1 Tax=Diploscapter pachys TaxID=2018661 RepID=A0A2A2LK02_9BILA|nr:hypothetical protein WR25_15037 [Diploscapter pachys]